MPIRLPVVRLRGFCAVLLGALCSAPLWLACPAQAQTVTEFAMIPSSGVNGGGLPRAIVSGPDGNVWFTQNNGRIGNISPTTGFVNIFSAGISGEAQSVGIAAGPDGNLWFTEYTADRIGMITPQGIVTEYPVTPGATPYGIAAGPDGNLWFAENNGHIGRISPSGAIAEFGTGISAGSQPICIASGPDGNLWFTELTGLKIGRITPSGFITEFGAGLAPGTLPYAITAGPDGNLWFTDVGRHQIGRITPAGVITMFSAGISANASPSGITTGPDGNLWFTEQGTGLIGRITTAGVVTEFSKGITPQSLPYGIAAGPDGNLWFAEYATSLIGRIDTGSIIPQTGYWWNPAEAGRGFNIEQRGGNLFMATFLYDASGRPTWYGVSGAITNGTYNGSMTSYSNGQTLTGAYKAPTVVGAVYQFSVTFTSPTQATITWPGGTETIQRYYFGTSNSAALPTPGMPEAGWWWAPTEGGRGYALEVQGGTMFLAGYMYDASGNPIWYASGPGVMSGTTSYSGTWAQFGNGQTLTGFYIPPMVVNSNVGKVTIQFSSTTTGVLTLPTGRQVAIQRFVF